MTAFIEGSVQTPTGRIVPMTIHAKPIPAPGKLADGNVIVAGNLAAGVRTPIRPACTLGGTGSVCTHHRACWLSARWTWWRAST